MASPETAAAASEECEKLLRMGDRVGRAAYDKKKLRLYTIISGSRRHVERLLREFPTLFNTIEDFLWFKLSAIRNSPEVSNSFFQNEGYSSYTLNDFCKLTLINLSPRITQRMGMTICAEAGKKLGVMNAFAEASSIIRQYRSAYLRHGNLSLALEYFAQAVATLGGGSCHGVVGVMMISKDRRA